MIVRAPGLDKLFLKTNDIIQIHSDTGFEWLGRSDNVINSGGIKIHPESIEEKLVADIEPAFFIGSLPDEQFGNRLILVMEIKQLSGKDLAELKSLIKTIDKNLRPRQLLLIESFVRTANGKIKRAETLERHAEIVALE